MSSELVARLSDFKHIPVSAFAHEKGFVSGFDEDYDTHYLDEDRLLDALEVEVSCGGRVVEYHNSELFPERWFDAVMVTRCNNTTLYKRMEDRGYQSESRKLRENLECEIFGVCLEEARDSYRDDIVFELTNETEEDLRRNLDFIAGWIDEWKTKPRNTGKRAGHGGQVERMDDEREYEASSQSNGNKKRVRKS